MISASPWQVIEFTIESERDRANPYLDVVVDAIFDGPDGRVVRRPAFWDGGRIWRVRFAAPASGRWIGRVSASDPSDAGLNRTLDDLTIVPAAGGRSGATHGPLRASDDGTYLVDAQGTPFLWLGDTHWCFAWERWGESNKPGWVSQFTGTVDKRVSQGFTVYQTNLMSFGRGWDVSPCWEPGEPFRKLRPQYFSEVIDPRMAYIADAGLVNAFGIGWYQSIDRDPEGMVAFARYLVARYGAAPMVWTLGGEVGGYDDDLREARLAGWRAVALSIREHDAYQHPITAHLTNERPLASYYQDEQWLTLTLNQLGHGDLDMNPTAYRALVDARPRRPVVEGESLYEGLISVEPVARRAVTATMVRQVAYRAMQSGCCGYTYGAQGCWNNAWELGDAASLWGDLPWYDGVDLPGAEHLGHLRRFYDSLQWWTLAPRTDLFWTSSGENARFYAPAVSSDASAHTVVVYFGETYRNDGHCELRGLSDGAYDVQWFDPRLGRWMSIERRDAAGGVLRLPDQPDPTEDWLLVASRRQSEGQKPL